MSIATSPAQIAANRANAQLSTGPVTEAGRARSSGNALKTGLTGRTVLLPGEDAESYQDLVAGLQNQYQPVGNEESMLVQSIADSTWRLFRIPCLEAGIYALGRIELKEQFQQQEPDPGIRAQLIEAKVYLVYHRQLNNLSIQESRLRRQVEKDTKRLHELQETRRAERRHRLALVAKQYLKAAETGQEAGFLANRSNEIGFEFSNDAIKSAAEALAPLVSSSVPNPQTHARSSLANAAA